MTKKTEIRSAIYFLLPSIGFLVFVFAVPLVSLFYYSLASWEWLSPTLPLGLHNYIGAIEEPQVLGSLIRNLIIGGATIPVTVVVSIVIAHFLYEKIFGWQFY